jgi:DNA (cytosine-5)-methyltransferase 1
MQSPDVGLTTISLFTGAGGLDVGLEAAGFFPKLCVEMDKDCRSTLRTNRPSWRLSNPADIHELSGSDLIRQADIRKQEVALLAGGPPCQPFSKSAYYRPTGAASMRDPRARTLKAYLAAVETVRPHVLLLENVHGLATGERSGLTHLARGLKEINRRRGTRYDPQIVHVNAADYGVPQVRERVFVIAHVGGKMLDVPRPTHGPDAPQPYRTCWDGIGDLDSPKFDESLCVSGKWAKLLPAIPEGENYLWHTARSGGEPLFGWRTRFWSFLLKLAKDRPSWTIQASPGPATGPFHWRNRRLSIDEKLRLQTFPAGYRLSGDARSKDRQIGNAVPCAIGEFLGFEIRRQLLGSSTLARASLIPAARPDCPKAERRRPVPKEFLSLRGEHCEHRGTGMGPAPAGRLS